MFFFLFYKVKCVRLRGLERPDLPKHKALRNINILFYSLAVNNALYLGCREDFLTNQIKRFSVSTVWTPQLVNNSSY